MTLDDLKKIKPIPGFDCVAMKHRAQLRIYEETKDMTPHELVEYFNRAGRVTRETGKISDSLVMREEPPLDE